MPLRLPHPAPSLDSVDGLFALQPLVHRNREQRALASVPSAPYRVEFEVIYLAPAGRRFPAGTVAVSVPADELVPTVESAALITEVWGSKARRSLDTTLLSWLFCHGAEAATADGHERWSEDWMWELESELAALRSVAWAVKDKPRSAHIRTMEPRSLTLAPSPAFPTHPVVAEALSEEARALRRADVTWRAIAQKFGITRLEALRLAHDLDGVLDGMGAARAA
ncbi:hypothetical protein [Arthrobacter sp. N1]|uniref:hypothetical protein n=1 Tax=Arthrobacter sp. N1 TaxID=619291 RepID=UPI003BB1B793